MSGRLSKKISTGKAAILVVLALGIVQYAWWRGLVYRPPTRVVPKPGGGMGPPAPLMIDGWESVSVGTYIGDNNPGDADGPGYAARLDRPTGLALDAQGNLYVADTGNHRIRKISPQGVVSTLAGSDVGNSDGPALQARFNAPCGVAVAPDGTVYVADTGNNAIRRIQNGQVTTLLCKSSPALLAGRPARPGSDPNCPLGIAYMPDNPPFLLVTDVGGHALWKVALNGAVESTQNLGVSPTAVAGSPQLAVALPAAETLLLGGKTLKTIPIAGAESIADLNKRPALRHPIALCPLGNDWLVTDAVYGAVFLVRQNQAEVLAGHVSAESPTRGSHDGEGNRASFSDLCGIVTDGKRTIYVSDTSNNTIRRLTLPATDSAQGRL